MDVSLKDEPHHGQQARDDGHGGGGKEAAGAREGVRAAE